MSKKSFFIKAISLIVIFLAGTLLISVLFPALEPQHVLFDSLFRVACALILYLFIWPEDTFGFSINKVVKKPTVIMLVGYFTLVIMLLLWKTSAIAMQASSPMAHRVQIIQAFNFYWDVVCVTPFFEEILFRGLLQTWAYQVFPGYFGIFSRATLITSLLFSLAHLPFLLFSGKNALYFILTACVTFLLGIILGVMRDKGGNLYWTMVLHSLANLIKL